MAFDYTDLAFERIASHDIAEGKPLTESNLLEALLAERAIQHVILDYAHGIDRLDFARVRSCFHADAEICYGGLADRNRDEALAWLEEALPQLVGSSHFFGAPRIELDLASGRAEVETYSLNTTRRPADESGKIYATHTSARYLDRFECRDAAWRIARRELVRDWTQWILEVPDPALPTQGARDPSRPV